MQKQTMESGVKEKAARWRASGVGYERPHFAFLLNTPALLIVVLLAGYPIVYSAWISLHKFSLKRPRVFDFVGLANYRRILESEEFWSALWVDSKSAVRRTTHLIMELSWPLVAIDRTSDQHQPLSHGSSPLATTQLPRDRQPLLLPLVGVAIGLVGLMVADYTAGRSAELAVACHVAGHAADHGSFDAALGFHRRDRSECQQAH